MKAKKFATLLVSSVMAASVLTGCGGVDKNAVVATLDGEEITLGVANFAARLQQASYDDFYVAYFGEEVWSSDLYGDGSTMESSLKDSVMETVQVLYTLRNHMDEYDVSVSEDEENAIAQATSDFIEANTQDALDALGADQETVEEYLTLVTIQSKMYAAIIAEADTDVSDEEANTSAYSYVRVSNTTYTDDDGNSVEYTEDELSELEDTLAAFIAESEADSMENAAEAYGYTVLSGTFSADDDSLGETVLAALEELDEGEISGVITTDSYDYVVRLDAVTDEEATEETRESIISDRQSEHYSEVVTAWEEEQEWVLKERVWATVTFDNLFTTVEESTETESTESADAESTESLEDTTEQ